MHCPCQHDIAGYETPQEWPTLLAGQGSTRTTIGHCLPFVACCLVVVLCELVTMASAGGAPSDPAPHAEGTMMTDEDGVQMLYPSAPGTRYRLGEQDPNSAPRFTIEKNMTATAHIDGALHYWNVPSYALTYASGGAGWTSRLHLYASGGPQRYTWKTQHGYLSNPADVRNQEFTAYVRIHQILDPANAALTLKIRGGAHTTRDGDLASCTMMTLEPGGPRAVTRFRKELSHPLYDSVPLTPAFTTALVDNQWYGLKLVSYGVPGDVTKVVNRLYVDTDPFDVATGKPINQWRFLSEYVDIEGLRTGVYTKLADWGGWQTTVRADGIHDLDFTLLSVREIMPPQ